MVVGVAGRVDQLDAEQLDSEVAVILSQQFEEACKYFIRNPWDSVGPELELVLKSVLVAGSLWSRGSSIGQQLLSLKFKDPSRNKLLVLGIINILRSYLSARQSNLTSLLPEGYDDKVEKMIKYLGILLNILEVVNFLTFLQHGAFPLLTHRILGLRHRSELSERGNQQFTYMSRELLWHSLSEMIIFTLPIISSSRLVRFFRREQKLEKDCCGVCSCPPVMRVTTAECDHVFCYYCAHARALPRCPVCGIALHQNSLQIPTIKKHL